MWLEKPLLHSSVFRVKFNAEFTRQVLIISIESHPMATDLLVRTNVQYDLATLKQSILFFYLISFKR